MNVFEGLKTSLEEITADVVGTAKEPELEAEPEDVMNCYNHIKF